MSDVQTTIDAAPDGATTAASSGPDLAAIANRLYANTAPVQSEQQPVTTQQTSESQPAEARPAEAQAGGELAPVPDAVRELRDDPLRRMFSPQGTFASVQLEEAMRDVALPAELKTAAAIEFREIFADIGASPQDAHELVNAVSVFSAEPVTAERDASNANDAIGLLNQHFGNDAANALKDAQQMIARDPRIVKMLDQSRLGNDPKTVLKIAQLARSAKLRG